MQAVFQWGETRTLMQQLTALPLPYFVDPPTMAVLMPTLLSLCYLNGSNVDHMTDYLCPLYISTYLRRQIAASPSLSSSSSSSSSNTDGPESSTATVIEGVAASTGANSGMAPKAGMHGSALRHFNLANRFPRAAWEDALTYFSEMATAREGKQIS
jgi:hypothetical protein